MILDVRTIGQRLNDLIAEYEKAHEGKKLYGAAINVAIGKAKNSGYVSRLRADKRVSPDPEAINKLADFFGVSWVWLQSGRGERRPKPGEPLPSVEAEMFAASLGGVKPFADGEGPDNLDVASLFHSGAFTPEVKAEYRAHLEREGIPVASLNPQEHAAALMDRQQKRLKAAFDSQVKSLEVARKALAELPPLKVAEPPLASGDGRKRPRR